MAERAGVGTDPRGVEGGAMRHQQRSALTTSGEKALCRDRPDAVDAIDRVCQQPTGPKGPRINSDKQQLSDNGRQLTIDTTSHKAGNSIEYGLRRLRKDRPDLHLTTPPSIERATITNNTERATPEGPGDSLSEAMREATLDYQLALARLEAVRRRLQGGGGPHRGGLSLGVLRQNHRTTASFCGSKIPVGGFETSLEQQKER
jgi:hypothetical protein